MANEEAAATVLQQERAAQLLEALVSKSSAEVKPLQEPEPETAEAVAISELKGAVRKIRKRGGKAYLVHERIVECVYACLSAAGTFYRADNKRLYYFKDCTLHSLSSEEFETFLAKKTGLYAKELDFQIVLSDLKIRATDLPVTKIHYLAFHDRTTGALFVSNGAGMMYARPRGGDWSLVPNGQGALFLTQAGREAFEADFSERGAALDWLLDQASFHDDPANLTRAEQRTLLLLTIIFNLLSNSTHIILVGSGRKGSGKSTTMQNIAFVVHGSQFKGTGTMPDRPLDDTVVALSSSAILLLDNVDSYIKGIEDVLATWATGIEYRRRKLWTDNEELVITLVTNILMMTARTARFARDDVAERTVPLSFLAPASCIGEEEMKNSVLSRRNAIMGDILALMGELADRLEYVKKPSRMFFRMADFAALGWVMTAYQDENGRWVNPEFETLLEKLTRAQDRFVGSDRALISTLDHVLTGRWELGFKGRPVCWSIDKLFEDCHLAAIKLSLPIPKTVIGFGQKFTQQMAAIQTELGVVIREEYKHAGARFITIFKKPEVAEYYLNGVAPCVAVQFSPLPEPAPEPKF